MSKLDAPRAEKIFTEAIHLDPNSAESWAGLADALHTMGAVGQQYDAFAWARDAANKALEIDPSQPHALMVLGVVSFLYDWNPTESEMFFRRSLQARPGNAMAHALFATTLAHRGKAEEAIQQIRLATASDPVSVLTNSQAWHVYFSARRYDEALRIILDTVEVDPTFAPADWRLAVSWEQRGEYQKAIDTGATGFSDLGPALAAGGPRGYWQGKLENLLQERRPGERFGFSAIARCYMHWGNGRKLSKRWKKGIRCGTPILFSGSPFMRSSIRCAQTRGFKGCSTALVFRDSPACLRAPPICKNACHHPVCLPRTIAQCTGTSWGAWSPKSKRAYISKKDGVKAVQHCKEKHLDPLLHSRKWNRVDLVGGQALRIVAEREGGEDHQIGGLTLTLRSGHKARAILHPSYSYETVPSERSEAQRNRGASQEGPRRIRRLM